MSLKAFHLVFIMASVALCFFFAYWCLESYWAGELGPYLLTAVLSAACGVGLLFYAQLVRRKLKVVLAAALLSCALMQAGTAVACAVCYGDPTHPTSIALTYAVYFLLGTIGMVLAGFVVMIVNYNRRCRNLSL